MTKFLILRFSSIGDIVLTTPVVRHLKRFVEDAEVHYATKQAFRPVIEHNPYIDKCFYLKDDFSTFIRDLKAEDYDYVIDLHRNLRTRRVKWALRKPSRTFDKINRAKWLHVNFKLGKLPDIHIVDRYLDTIREFAAKKDGEGLDYFPDAEAERVMDKLPEPFHKDGYVAIVIGAMHFTKQIPQQRIVEIVAGIKQAVVLLGGPDEKEKAKEILQQTGRDDVLSMVGECSLNASAVLVREAQAVVTSDTGLMHMAAAFNKPTFSLWGSTIPEYGMYPYLPAHPDRQHIYEVKGLSCRSCSKIGHPKCPKKHFDCMEKIPYAQLINEINNVCKA